MKQIIKILAVISMVLLSAGCNRAPESEVSSAISENSSVGNTSSTDSSVSPSSSSHTEMHTESIPEKNNVRLNYEMFNGLPKSENPLNTVNSKDFRPSLLCYGDGNTFFMWDGTVYKHNGETTEALFEKNAYDLNYYDGMLYFIENDRYDISSRDEVHIEGLLYRYDLNKGVLETLTDYPVTLPVVSKGEIFYTDYATANDPEPPTGIYRINDDGTSERLYSGLKYIAYGEYRLKFDWSGEEKVYFSCGDKALLLENVHSYWDCIVGDYYYYRSQVDNTLNRLSVLTGELTTLEPENEENGFFCMDYTVLNDIIYLIGDRSELLKYNYETGDYTEIDCKYAFRYIYADDKNIYGVGCEREENSINHTFHFIKLTIDGETADGEILA